MGSPSRGLGWSFAMTTITGPLILPWGEAFTGQATFKPYPEGLAKIVGTDTSTAAQIVVEFVDGEPESTLLLTEGSYTVKVPQTSAFIIAVPAGSGTSAIGAIVSDDAVNPTALDVGVPAGGTDGQVLTKQSGDDYDVVWETPSGGGGGGSGDVVGPASATDNAVARFDSTTGKLIQNSIVAISDAGAITGVASITMTASDSTTRVLTIHVNQSGQYAMRIT